MSTIKVNRLENTSTANGGIDIDTDGHVQFDGLQLPTDGALSNRNLIINGAMQVAQRGTSVSGNTGNGYTTLDRMGLFQNLGGLNISQSSEAPSGFYNSIKYEVDSTGSAVNSTIVTPHQIVEGYSIAHLNWGSSDAQSVTFSFWVRSSITGTYGAWIRNAAETRYQPKEFTVTSANTWEKKILTFTGETSGTWDVTNGRGLAIGICLDAGSNRYGTADTWNTSGDAFTTSNQTNFMANSGATFYLTGVQLEVGTRATPFEHRSYGDELAKCQRYYWQIQNPNGTNNSFGWLGTSYGNGNSAYVPIHFVTSMRTRPSLAMGGSWRTRATNINNFTGDWNTHGSGSPESMIVAKSGAGNLPANTVYWLEAANQTGETRAFLKLNSEL